jgi:hypothetical protein
MLVPVRENTTLLALAMAYERVPRTATKEPEAVAAVSFATIVVERVIAASLSDGLQTVWPSPLLVDGAPRPAGTRHRHLCRGSGAQGG